MLQTTERRTAAHNPAYRLTVSQTRALELEHKYKAMVGGVGSGKTYFGTLWALMQGAEQGNGMIVAPTYRMLHDVTGPMYLERLREHRIPHGYYKAEDKIQLAVGMVYMRSGEHPDRLRGPNLTWALIDEAAYCREEVWKVILGRLRLNNAHALITTSPAGYNWVYRYFIEIGHENYGLVHASTRDNPYLDTDFVENLEAVYSDEYAAQEIEGQFVAFEGLVWKQYQEEVHVIEPHEIPKDWPRYRAIDFGYTNPFVCLWGATDPDGRLIIYDEHYEARRLIADHAEIIKSAEAGKYQATVADHDAQDIAELRMHGIISQPADKRVSVGIQRVAARMKTQGDGKPRLYIMSNCIHLRSEIRMYRWADKVSKEEPLKEKDHACDALRYMVMKLDGRPGPRVRTV